MMDVSKIRDGISTPVEIKMYDITDSTNLRAKEYAADCDGHVPVLFIAKEQSAGRGRLGRQFLSRANSGIYMSLLYFTDSHIADAVSITTAAAVFVAEGIESVTDKPMKIKWVNDVYSDMGKVSGILTESLRIGDKNAIIVGIGINTGNVDFPDELKGIAATVGNIEGRENELITYIIERLIDQSRKPQCRKYMNGYRERFMLAGQFVTLYKGGEAVGEGTVRGVTDDGGLVFLRDGEEEEEIIHSGEVTVRKVNS